ncbi:hypothetical protein C5167_043602 [Papaver somniferum]|uniref:Leucine-rich repeat-containing N-terminal plant-type domain-containing protein n=1 Tax=Papaver somniferum TaxID=3469 RepID=A0A4Y7L8N0_PAPSO|nr:hypothetical protein C5167_043602 [Papaver somniferum]
MKSLQSAWIFLIFLILSFSSSDNSCVRGKCRKDQRALVLQLNQSLISSMIFSKRSSWSLSRGHIVGLDLSSEDISDGLDNSSSLFKLHTLIPSGFDQLFNLNYLNLSHSGFFGKIPKDISRMTRVERTRVRRCKYF